jgi:hypothetical protein
MKNNIKRNWLLIDFTRLCDNKRDIKFIFGLRSKFKIKALPILLHILTITNNLSLLTN